MAFNQIYQVPAIASISLKGHQCFPEGTEELPLDRYTFIYGPNGSGKSTILREFRHEPDCVSGEVDLRTFDHEFIRGLLNLDHSFEGVLQVIDAPEEVANRLMELTCEGGELAKAEAKFRAFNKTLEDKEEETERELQSFRGACWELKKMVPKELLEIGAHMAVRSKKQFADAVMARLKNTDKPTLQGTQSFEEISRSLAELGEEGQPEYPLLPALSAPLLVPDSIWELSVKSLRPDTDSPLAALLEQLGHSDWVKKGIGFMDSCQSECPFCQQSIPDDLEDKLRGLFAAEYELAVKNLQDFGELIQHFQEELDSFTDSLTPYPDAVVGDLKTQIKDQKRYALELGKQLEEKLRDMTATDVFSEVKAPADLGLVYQKASQWISEINKKRRNITAARRSIGDDVFDRFCAEFAINEFQKYEGATSNAQKAIRNVRMKRQDAQTQLETLQQEIRELEAQTSSTAHVMNEVNSTLEALGFTRFRLIRVGDDGSRYRVVREDGELAGPTLSEGEKTLVSFLYFYHQVKNASKAGGKIQPLVVVIDDPISSLDSTTLFAVSLLCRDMIDLCKAPESRMCQFILLTHNAYFFQEVTFKKIKENQPEGTLFYTESA